MASKSSTLLNAPYDFRICKIFSAVTGPMPGTCCNSSDVAVLMFTGFTGGFFLASAEKETQNQGNANCESPPRHSGCIMLQVRL